MITMQNVRKTYGSFTFEMSMELPEGQILGLIGKNGAGKSKTGDRSFSGRIRIFRGTDRK
jgi:ABC-2 type transport system ATP-binding protein